MSPGKSESIIKHIKDMVGTFAWYVQSLDPTMEAILSSIASRQSNFTENLEQEVKHFLDYCATHPNAGVRFHAIDIILEMHSYYN